LLLEKLESRKSGIRLAGEADDEGYGFHDHSGCAGSASESVYKRDV
jgi:hypothetical protein